MQPQLKLTEIDTPLVIEPDVLLTHLEKSISSMDKLCEDLHCTLEDIYHTIADPRIALTLRLQVQLAAVQIRLLAAQYAPHAIARLIHLANTSEKPEVARRSATTLLHIAGIPTTTESQPADPIAQLPAPPPASKEGQDKMTPQQAELFATVAHVLTMKRAFNLDLTRLPKDKFPQFVRVLQDFFKSIDLPYEFPYKGQPPTTPATPQNSQPPINPTPPKPA